MMEDIMDKAISRPLRKAIQEYYKWHGDRKAKPIKYIFNKGGLEAILVYVTDKDGDRICTLMEFQKWADGHYDVTEFDFADITSEALLVADYEQSI